MFIPGYVIRLFIPRLPLFVAIIIALLFYSKTQLAIKNLNQPIEEISTFPKSSKQEPGAAAWNPHTANADLLALAVSIFIVTLNEAYSARLAFSPNSHFSLEFKSNF